MPTNEEKIASLEKALALQQAHLSTMLVRIEDLENAIDSSKELKELMQKQRKLRGSAVKPGKLPFPVEKGARRNVRRLI